MAYELNNKVKGLVAYDAVTENYKIRLDANESFINPGTLMKDEILEAISKVSFNRYPDASCKILREKFGELYGVDPEHVIAGNGSDELITVIMGAFLMGGDKLLTFTPDFSMYQFYGHAYEKEGIVIEKNDDLVLTVDKAIDSINRLKPQAVLFSNPCSPSSLVIKRADVIKIVESTDCLIILDEAYMEFSSESILDLADKFDNLIILKTCSKALGCAAIRLGFLVSSPKIVNALNAVRSPYNINSLTQAVGTVVLSNKEYIKESIEKIIASREELYKGLVPLEGKNGVKRIIKPDTNFVYMEMDNAKFVYNELIKRSIIVRKLGNALRITAGNPDENKALINAMFEILKVCNC
ncbi:pyridoxal phosphate-dependent aminotransferase [Anaerovorax odorimutans]|uniref:pyridoxal phosphate-dependent aminotransferase n=1 Tax=Anaerovorax odorimutans TaxID=109327 RepID=UPI00041E0528|nr:aminotransferase class I/II-fold pyridoxal phosphate-dependent enzyme [Anaerovorax odorimutans]